jgi:long-chain acyl-CoA synthetase
LNHQSLTTVFLYDTLGPDSLEYIINHSEISVLVASDDKVNKILAVSNKCPTLKYIIILPTIKKSEYQASATKLLQYKEVMEMVNSQ